MSLTAVHPARRSTLHQAPPALVILVLLLPNHLQPRTTTINHQTFKNLRLPELNFQSVFSKRAEFWNILDATKPDVVFGCETWLKPSTTNGEIFSPGYGIYRCDRKDGYGGVLLAVHSSLNNHQIITQPETELVVAKIINDKQTIILASLYDIDQPTIIFSIWSP